MEIIGGTDSAGWITATIKGMLKPVPNTFSRLCRDHFGNRTSINHEGSTVHHLTPTDEFYWNMICKDAVGCLVHDEDTISQCAAAIDYMVSIIGEDCIETFSEWAQERAIMQIENLPSDIRDDFKSCWPLYAGYYGFRKP